MLLTLISFSKQSVFDFPNFQFFILHKLCKHLVYNHVYSVFSIFCMAWFCPIQAKVPMDGNHNFFPYSVCFVTVSIKCLINCGRWTSCDNRSFMLKSLFIKNIKKNFPLPDSKKQSYNLQVMQHLPLPATGAAYPLGSWHHRGSPPSLYARIEC